MPVGSPFHERTHALCRSYKWKEWAGYHAVKFYNDCHEPEYLAFRHAAGLIDVSPLFKYDVRGKDAGRFLAYVTARDVLKIKPDRVTYCCWTDDKGKMLDDGTIMMFAEDHYRVTTAAPSYEWFTRNARGFDATVEDVSESIASLSIQGPFSRDVLKKACDAPLDKLKFFGLAPNVNLDGMKTVLTRTGYTGDLGYEVWCERSNALKVWDALMAAGKDYGLLPCGLDAMDITRVEAGFILQGIEYHPADTCLIESRKSSPFEVGMGWTVHTDRAPFIGQDALKRDKAHGVTKKFVGLELDWLELERMFWEHGLPPEVPSGAWRADIPVYADGLQVGRATSGTWSPILKKNIALASLDADYAREGDEVAIEWTVEYERRKLKATVRKPMFFDPPRKKA